MSKTTEAQEAIDAATQRRREAARKHPHAVDPTQPPPIAEDADDKPVYSVKQVERMMAANINPAAPPASGSLQQASFPALMRELDRRRDEAQTKLAGIPTELLELELQRRKKDQDNG